MKRTKPRKTQDGRHAKATTKPVTKQVANPVAKLRPLDSVGIDIEKYRRYFDGLIDFNAMQLRVWPEHPRAGHWDYELRRDIMARAAIDLYEACAALVHCAELEMPYTDMSHMDMAIDMGRKALAKATGGKVEYATDKKD